MKKRLITFITIGMLAACALKAANIQKAPPILPDGERHAVREKLRNELANATNAQDSLKLLFDIYDLTESNNKRGEAALEVMQAAKAAGDTLAVYDMLRQASQYYSLNDDKYKWLIAMATQMPAGDNRRETETFMRLSRLSRLMRKLDAGERREVLNQRLDQFHQDVAVDRWRRIEILFTMCLYMTNTQNSPMLAGYLDDLDKLITSLPSISVPMRNLYSVTAANVYTSVGNLKAAVKADKALVDEMNQMREDYQKKGRIYRNFGPTRYIVYRRLLGNGKALTPEEIEHYYAELKKLIREHKELAKTEESTQLTDAYYYMAKKEYAKALPLLQKAVELKTNHTRKFLITGMIVEAAKATGNNAVLVPAIEQYMQMLEKRITDSEKDRIIEYQIMHDVEGLQQNKEQLEVRNQQLESKISRSGRYVSYAILAGLIIVLVVFIIAYTRTRKIRRELEKNNILLTDERDKLRRTQQDLIVARDNADIANRKKTEFMHNVSHEIAGPTQAIVGFSQLIVDTVDDKNRQYLQRFSDIIDINARLLQAQVNDLLDAAELENYNVSIKMRNTSAEKLVDLAVASVSEKIKPDVSIEIKPFTPDDEHLELSTDVARAEQVLVKLINNAVKFTEKGTVTVAYGLRDKKVLFVVEDTGPGIPAEKAEVIFDRFEKLSNYAGGLGLGLHIARLVAKLLGGEVSLDTTYTDGARFVFELPYEKA